MSTIFYKPGDSYYCMFPTTRFSTGAKYNATGTPVATAYNNGVEDSGFALTVTNVTTGLYKITGTVPATYVANDLIDIVVTATVDGVAAAAVVDRCRIIAAGAIVTSVGPVASSDSKVTVVIGDDYLLADSRQLAWSFTGMPSITGATVTFKAQLPDGTLFTKAGTVTSSTACYVALTRAETVLWTAGTGRYDVEASLATSGDVVTLINRAVLLVREDLR